MRSRTAINRENRWLRNTGQAYLIPSTKGYGRQPKQLISYFDMTLEEFIKKTNCSISSQKDGLKYPIERKTYHLFVNKDGQIVKAKNGIMPDYVASFNAESSRDCKMKAWIYIIQQRLIELRGDYKYNLIKNLLIHL
jgi:hypothetical protein